MSLSNKINEYHLHKEIPSKRQFEMFDLREYMIKNISKSSRPHSHSFYQIIWFYNDQGKHFIDFKAYPIASDKLFFIAKNQVHYFEHREDYNGIVLHFNESFLIQKEKDIEVFINYNLFNNEDSPFFQISRSIKLEFVRYMDQLKSEINNVSDFGHQAILSNTLKSFLIRIEREKRKISGSGIMSNEDSMLFLQFRKLVEAKYKENISISAYAKELNLSTKTLNSLVKSKTGKTTSQVLKQRVILEAKRQLCHSKSLVNEIGYDLGFQDPSYFVKFFKKHVKSTPSEFRNSIA